MIADPLGDIGLRGHHALLKRTVPGELKILFFAIGRIRDGTNGQDDFNQSVLHSKHGSSILRPIFPNVSNFDKNLVSIPLDRHVAGITTAYTERCPALG
jgi:hypothetical protein